MPDVSRLFRKIRKPDRVLITDEGLAVSPRKAVQIYGAGWEIVFIRKDGWTLGAPRALEQIAYRMWEDEWKEFSRMPFVRIDPISEYN